MNVISFNESFATFRFPVEESLGRNYFKYYVGICTSAELLGQFENAGVCLCMKVITRLDF